MRLTKKILIITMLIIDIIFAVFYLIFYNNPSITENIYSTGIFPIITFVMGRISDILLFSISEIFVLTFFIGILLVIILGIIKVINKKKSFKETLFSFFQNAFIVISILFIWFYGICNFNYFREPLKIKRSEENTNLNQDKFEKLLIHIINKTNDLYNEPDLNTSDITIIVNKNIHTVVYDISGKNIFPAQRIKLVLTGFLFRTNTAGVVSPLFLESHISSKLFKSELPFTIAHEKAHLFGYLNETEANYLAFITCLKSENKYLNYSAYVEMLAYFLSDYYYMYPEGVFEGIYNGLREEIRAEYRAKNKRFEKYQSKFVEQLWGLYSLYLQANKIEGGTKAYSMVVQMLLESEFFAEEVMGK